MRNWIAYDTESQLLDEVSARRARLKAMRAGMTTRRAASFAAYASAYPWMAPGAAQSLALSGLPVDSPQAQSIADIAAQQAADDGELTDPAEEMPDAWYETMFNAVGKIAKPIVRTGFTILSTPMEELQALLSSGGTALFDETKTGEMGMLSHLGENIGAIAGEFSHPAQLVSDFWTNYTEKAARSGGLLALGDLLSGKEVDLGQGFLPGGEIYEEREKAKYRLQLHGQFVTPGRLIANYVDEPGTKSWQILSGINDASQQIFIDPANVGLTKLSKAQEATRTFQTLGLVSGLRRTVAPERAVNHFLTSGQGRRMVSWFAQNADLEDAWRAIGKADLHTAQRLVDAQTDADVFGVLTDVLGTKVRTRPTAGFVSRTVGGVGGNDFGALFGGGARVRRSLSNMRMGLEMPGQVMNVHDINHAALQLDSWMRNAKIPDQVRKARMAELAQVADGDGIGLFEAARKVMDDTEGILTTEWGIGASRAKQLTQMYADLADNLHTFGVDGLGRHEDVLAPLKLHLDGDVVETPRGLPLLQSEMANEMIPLPPHAREIRRLTPAISQMQGLYDSGLWKGSIDHLDAFMSSIWKPFQLLRGAYTLRVIAEEQVRMAASGYDSMFRHPLSAVAWNLSVDPSSKMGKRLAEWALKPLDEKGSLDVLGQFFDEAVEHQAALSRGSAGWRGLPGEVATGRFVKARHGEDPDFYRGWGVELTHMSNDPVMRRLAGGLKEGELRGIGGTTGNVVDDVKEWFWSAPGGKKFRQSWGRIEGRSALLTDRQAADGYIDLFVDRLSRSTGGNTDLLEAVASGRLGDTSLRAFGQEGKVAKLLEGSYDEAAPLWTKKPETIRVGAGSGGHLDRVVEKGFNSLMSRPTNWLSRSPTFRQAYWNRIGELIGFADRPTQEAILVAARDAGIGDNAVKGLASKVLVGEGSRLSKLDDVDTLAKAFALDETRKLLYDLSKRSQFFDAARLIFPFGEAWKEIITAWTSILRKNPQAIRRFQQGITAAREPSVLGEAETTPGTGQGFFHPDPQTGEEVFTYPAGWVGKLLGINQGGVGVQFTGRVQGLNLVAATVVPGFGPAVQIPASVLIPNTPNYEDLREFLLPFGEAEGDRIGDKLVNTVLPAWIETTMRSFDDPEKHRLFGNTVADVMRALQASGRYDLHSTAGQQQLYDDAVSKARRLYLIRGLAQSTLPTGPSFTWTTEDTAGNVVPVKILSDELRRLTVEEYGGDRAAAFQEWVRRFGVDNVLAVIGKSAAIVERPVTEKGDEWLRAHPDLERSYGLTIGYFAPEPITGEFDYTAYLRQLETGARIAVTPKEQLALANDFLGRLQWEQAKKIAAFRPGSTTNLWLAQVRDQIAEQYPGFDGWTARKVREQRPTTEQQIAEARRAVQNTTIANTDAGQGTILYLSALTAADQMVARLGGNVTRYQQAKAAKPIRDWLRSVARSIIEDHPDFARIWDGVFERELADDEEVAAA